MLGIISCKYVDDKLMQIFEYTLKMYLSRESNIPCYLLKVAAFLSKSVYLDKLVAENIDFSQN